MRTQLSRFILWLTGWKVVGTFPDYKKYIIIVCPHTSNWDFVLGKLGFFSNGKTGKMLIKKEFFRFPIKWLLLKVGGVPVDRLNSTSSINKLIKIIKDADEFILTITPEGTRKKTKNWKTGFYFISEKAELPIIIGKIDYKHKELIMMHEFIKTGNVEEDMKTIKSYYKESYPKYPENFTAED